MSDPLVLPAEILTVFILIITSNRAFENQPYFQRSALAIAGLKWLMKKEGKTIVIKAQIWVTNLEDREKNAQIVEAKGGLETAISHYHWEAAY